MRGDGRSRHAAAIEPIKGLVGKHIGRVGPFLHVALVQVHLVHHRVVVAALTFDDVPIIESGRRLLEVPLSNQCRLVAGPLEPFGHVVSARIECPAERWVTRVS